MLHSPEVLKRAVVIQISRMPADGMCAGFELKEFGGIRWQLSIERYANFPAHLEDVPSSAIDPLQTPALLEVRHPSRRDPTRCE